MELNDVPESVNGEYAHRRAFASVHSRIPYQPITARSPIEWPGGAPVAVWVIPNVEHYEYLPPPSETDPYPRTPHPDVRKYSYHDYGNRVGFWRMLEVFDQFEVPATVALNAAVLDHYPELSREMVSRNWDFMSHGVYNTRYLTGMSIEDEREFFKAANSVLNRHVGHGFRGMLGPHITGNIWTPDLMAEVGMTYHADWVHDERPSPLVNASGIPMVALPYSYELNDAPLLVRSYLEADEYSERCIAQFERLQADAARWGGLTMALPLHPFTIGQPHRIGGLVRVLSHLRDRGAWLARASEIVDHYLTHYYADDLQAAWRA